MADWVFWSVLAAMLWFGHLLNVGVFLLQFSLSAWVAALAAGVSSIYLEQQLHLFLFVACLQMLVTRFGRVHPREL